MNNKQQVERRQHNHRYHSTKAPPSRSIKANNDKNMLKDLFLLFHRNIIK